MTDAGSPLRPLKVLIVTQYFVPEMGAPAARFHDFGRLLAERGHRVSVLTAFPNSPSGVIPAPYRGRLTRRERIDALEVRRSWILASPRASALARSAGFVSFAASASLIALLARLEADAVIATAPPPTVGVPALLAARRLAAPLLFDVRDLWPEALVASGRLRNPGLIRVLEHLERRLYRAAAAVTVVTEGKRERLLAMGVPAEKVSVLPNGVDLSRFDAPGCAPDPGALGVGEDRFVVIYAGVFNPAQGLDVLLDAATRLAGHDASRIRVVLVGTGAERGRLEQRVRTEGLADRVRLLPEQPRERIPALLRAADAVAVTLRPRRDRHTVPSKLYEALASGRPVLLSADGAPAELIGEAGAGLVSAAGDAPALARSMRALAADPELARRLGAAGRRAARRFDRRVQVEQLEGLLQRIARPSRPRPHAAGVASSSSSS